MLVDTNILLYAIDTDSLFHERARIWLEGALNGNRSGATSSATPRSLRRAWSTASPW